MISHVLLLLLLFLGGIVVEGLFDYKRYEHETWTKVSSKSDSLFGARSGHATCQFKNKMWLIGGRTAEYDTWNLQATERNADVWYTDDGVTWTKILALDGHFKVQNADVKAPGPIAPWYARFGHTLDAMDLDGDNEADIMVLTGGYTPQPSNDVWITQDGVTWEFVDYAPWSGRAWHASAIYNNSLYILGGTPLNNEVWTGVITKDASQPFRVWYGRAYLRTRWHIAWRNLAAVSPIPWAPRAGHKTAVQYSQPYCQLYVIGGYGGYNDSYQYYNGLRSRSDVWVTNDGVHWQAATYAAPWAPRAFHDVVVWHDPTNITQDAASQTLAPRIWVAGGGYMGTKGNNIVYIMQGYIDLWWTRDGAKWYRVDWEQGSGDNLFSTNTWAKTSVSGKRVYSGKWGHRLQHYRSASNEDSLYVIAGTHVGGGDMVQDVWKSTDFVVCDLDGVSCSGHGTCQTGLMGCKCEATWGGEYCQDTGTLASPAAPRRNRPRAQHIVVGLVMLVLVHLSI